MEIRSSGHWRYPVATVVEVDDDFYVAARGRRRRVMFHDVPRAADLAAAPLRMRATLAEAREDLRRISLWRDAAGAADLLAAHVREFGLPELCEHGQGPRHQRGPQDARFGHRMSELHHPLVDCPMVMLDATPAVRLGDVLRFARALEAVEDVHHALRHGQPVKESAYDAIADWDGGHIDTVGARLSSNREEPLREAEPRLMVTNFVEGARAAAGVRAVPVWTKRRGRTDVMVSTTLLGCYLEHVWRTLDTVDPGPVVLRCSYCGDPLPPRRRRPSIGQNVYCKAGPCQRAKERLNKANQRARKRKPRAEHPKAP